MRFEICTIFAIGGAEGKSAIAALLKLIHPSPAPHVTGAAKSKKRVQQPLCRPLIAICNDVYAPVLRPLRNVAKVVTFKQAQVYTPPPSPLLLCHFKTPLLLSCKRESCADGRSVRQTSPTAGVPYHFFAWVWQDRWTINTCSWLLHFVHSLLTNDGGGGGVMDLAVTPLLSQMLRHRDSRQFKSPGSSCIQE